jgi:hypothetical protein
MAEVARLATSESLIICLRFGAMRRLLAFMARTETPAPLCAKCGKHLNLHNSILEPKSGRTFNLFKCECGNTSYTSEKK